MEKNSYLSYIGILLSAIILCFSISFILIEKEDFSENENRYLETFPELTFEKLVLVDYDTEEVIEYKRAKKK